MNWLENFIGLEVLSFIGMFISIMVGMSGVYMYLRAKREHKKFVERFKKLLNEIENSDAQKSKT